MPQPRKFQGWWMNCCKSTGIARQERSKKSLRLKCRNRFRPPVPAVPESLSRRWYINGQKVTLIALPLIFQQFRDSGKPASQATTLELLETVKIYNPIPTGEDEAYAAVAVT